MLSEEIENRLARERRARLAAERLLAQKQQELRAVNDELSKHAFALSDQIVEQRHEAEELKDENFQVRSDLQRAEKRLWTSVETIEDGFAVFDSARRLILANPAYLSVFDGLEEVKPGIEFATLLELAVGEGIVDTEGLSREDWCAMMQARWASTEIEPIVVRLWNGFSIKLVERRGEDGDIVTLALNITETIRKEGDLTDARHRAEAASRAKSAFLANMSHELRTPMNGVVGMASLLLEGPLDEEQRLYVDTIRQSGEALIQIINEVLDFSKMEAEKLELHPQPLDLEQLVHEVVLLSLPGAQEKGVKIALDFDMFLPARFIGDQGRLRQILTNLIGNAVKFTAEGHVAIRVVGFPKSDEVQQVIINIEDTGIGIAPEMTEFIFGEFNQAEDERNRNFEGTGLGLAITKRLVDLMGGDIWVESELGKGSCFSFRVDLPIDCTEATSDPGFSIEHISKVLVVDDDHLSRDMLVKQLIRLGLEVVQADTVSEAQDRLGAEKEIDLVLTGYTLPDASGVELARSVQCSGKSRQVVLVSRTLVGHMSAEDRSLFAASLTQPVLRSDLLRTLATLPRPAPLVLEKPLRDVTNTDAALSVAGQEASDEPIVELGPFSSARKRNGSQTRIERPASEPLSNTEMVEIEPAPPFFARRFLPASELAHDSKPDTEANPVVLVSSSRAFEPANADPEASNMTARRVKVLAAEDNRTNQLVFRKMLRSLNLDLQFAGNGLEALELYKSFSPDIVFMDISMPKMDGMEATRAIRELEKSTGRTVPITAMTAHAMDGDAERILAAGLDFYLTKPLKKVDVCAKIEELMPQDCAPLRLDTAAE
ncbi:MAG: response regulator [Dinoroseobacter sp.]|nr:response regulator [Dinoroseobacter sp.]